MSECLIEKEFVEIEYPNDMIPILTKDKTIIWYNEKYVGINPIRNVDVLLYDRFTSVFNKLKLYIDVFNFTYFVYKKEVDFINANSEKYDELYGLNNDLLEKVNLYRKDLNKYLTVIHDTFNVYYEILNIKHKTD